jgi:hypothetical protein
MKQRFTITIEAVRDTETGEFFLSRMDSPLLTTAPNTHIDILRAAIRSTHAGPVASGVVKAIVGGRPVSPAQLLKERATPGEIGALLDMHHAREFERLMRLGVPIPPQKPLGS